MRLFFCSDDTDTYRPVKHSLYFFYALNSQYSFFAFIDILPDWNVTLKKILFFGSLETRSLDLATYLYFSVEVPGLKE